VRASGGGVITQHGIVTPGEESSTNASFWFVCMFFQIFFEIMEITGFESDFKM
jgi:hypothetical protein